MSDPRSEETVAAWTPADLDERLRTLAPHEQTFSDAPGETVAPEVVGRQTLKILDELRETPDARLVVEDELLGEGGMSVVHLGTQKALGRKVAVKGPKAGAGDEEARELFREAWITGQLEHPHVMPVYDVALRDGRPLIVLKRIEGVPWSALMKDPAQIRERFGVDEVLPWQLQTFMQVCNAIHYAHSRDVVHRDIKPSNVMIGTFGEVYVTDWGIAVKIRPEGGYDPEVLAGTPVYLAPEMVLGEPVDERTDVYLLGGTLYEILTGQPPHMAGSLHAIARKVLSSKPLPFPDDVPHDLAAICRKCMRLEPKDRYESAEEVRRALARYLERRDSLALAEASMNDLLDLEAGVREALEAPEERYAKLYDLFGACRFGFKAALRAWTDNPAAKEGLRRAISAMIELEIARLNARGAAVLLEELDNPPVELQQRVQDALEERAAAQEKVRALAAFRAELDPAVGRKGRFRVAMLLFAVVVSSPILQHFTADPNTLYRRRTLAPLAYLTVLVVLSVWRRRELFASRYNRQLVFAGGLIFVSQSAFSLGQWSTGIDPIAASVHSYALVATGILMISAFVDRRFLTTAIIYYAMYFGATIWIDWHYLFAATGNAALGATMLWLWRPRRREDP